MRSRKERHAPSEQLAEAGAARGPSGFGEFNPLGTQSEQARRTRRIEARRAQANLLLAATNQDSLRTQVRLAVRDLDEAAMWLNAMGSVTSQSVLGLADALLRLSGCRLDRVRTLLGTFRADAVPSDANA